MNRRMPVAVAVPLIAAVFVGGMVAGVYLGQVTAQPEPSSPATCREAVEALIEVQRDLSFDLLVPALDAIEGERDPFTITEWVDTLTPIATAGQQADLLARACMTETEAQQ